MSCLVCGTTATSTCSLCTAAAYCSRECQATHWKAEHRAKCPRQTQQARDAERGFSDAELATCVRVLNCFKKFPEQLKEPWCRELRGAGMVFAEGVTSAFFQGQELSRAEYAVLKRKEKQRIQKQQKQEIQKHINKTEIRSARNSHLSKLLETSEFTEHIPALPSTHETDATVEDEPESETRLTTRTAATTGSLASVLMSVKPENPEAATREIPLSRSCYICKIRFFELDSFYDQLCPPCAALSWKKRNQSADLRGKVALVTGGRVKIGFTVAMKLLRCGASVIVTTRFPVDAVRRFAAEPDFSEWKDRVFVYGLDFRDLRAVSAFAIHIATTQPRLDILINNAAQTVRRPPAYYAHLLESEREGERVCGTHTHTPSHSLLSHYLAFKATAPSSFLESGAATNPRLDVAPEKKEGDTEMFERHDSAMLTQVAVIAGDDVTDEKLFPRNALDVEEQQVDMRSRNSWLLHVDEVEIGEMVETFAINACGPFVLVSKLLSLMKRHDDGPRFIVNVSAMEGKFYRFKMPTHPHTNMAKAALNMLTRTSSQNLATQHHIYMNSVDTGWITDENPVEKAKRVAEEQNFQPPIDHVEAMARILDPVMVGVNEGRFIFGKFLKDYAETEW